MLQTLFAESRQIDDKLSELISESMESLGRTRTIINTKTNEFKQKTDDMREELDDRSTLIRNTESTITMMLELINTLNQLNMNIHKIFRLFKSILTDEIKMSMMYLKQ